MKLVFIILADADCKIMAWYYIIVIVLAVVAVIWFLAGKKKCCSGDDPTCCDNPKSGQNIQEPDASDSEQDSQQTTQQ